MVWICSPGLSWLLWWMRCRLVTYPEVVSDVSELERRESVLVQLRPPKGNTGVEAADLVTNPVTSEDGWEQIKRQEGREPPPICLWHIAQWQHLFNTVNWTSKSPPVVGLATLQYYQGTGPKQNMVVENPYIISKLVGLHRHKTSICISIFRSFGMF